MAAADWTALTGSLAGGDVARGASRGITPPSGGGTSAYVMNALTAAVGAVGLYATPQAPNTNFNPLLKGCDIRAALQRGIANGNSGYSAFLFALAQGTAITDLAYMLGLADGDPAHIVLRKGAMQQGLPDVAPGGVDGVLRRSTTTYAPGTWLHLRLECAVNTNGDVVINCYRNDLGANPVTAPVWAAIPGMTQYIDDLAGINSGSLPFLGGRAGFGGQFAGVTRRVYVDHLELIKQT